MATILRSVGNQLRVVGTRAVVNKALNPGFEAYTSTVPDSWIPINSTLTSYSADKAPESGLRSVRVATQSTQSTVNGVGQTVNVIGGAYLYVALSFKVLNSFPNGSNLALETTFFDPSGTSVGTSTNTLSLGAATSDWQKASLPTAVPPTAATANVALGSKTGSLVFFLDNVLIRDSFDSATQYPFISGDYSTGVWSGVAQNSTTLQSTSPEALHRFDASLTPVPFTS